MLFSMLLRGCNSQPDLEVEVHEECRVSGVGSREYERQENKNENINFSLEVISLNS